MTPTAISGSTGTDDVLIAIDLDGTLLDGAGLVARGQFAVECYAALNEVGVDVELLDQASERGS